MNKTILTLILVLSFSFATQQETEQNEHYAKLDNNAEVVIAAYHKKKQDSPLRKRYHKRKRRVRNPAQGK
tara:strand:- start:295 stop:504 length:210 start_codon:yes stop_codon:yes gene_type:complete